MKSSLHNKLKKYENIQLTNQFLYKITTTPILEYFFHKDLVAEYEAKEGINIAINSIMYLVDLFKKIVYIAIIYMLLQTKSNSFAFFFIMLTITGCIYKKINKFDEKDYDKISLLRVDSNQYVKHKINYYIIKEFILMSIAMLLIYSEMKINYLVLIYLVFIYICIHIITEKIHIKRVEKSKYKRKELLTKFISLLCLGILGILYYYDIYIPNKITIISSLILIPIGITSYIYLINYNNYKQLHRENLDFELIKDMKMLRNINNNNNVQVTNNTATIDINAKIEEPKTGFEYLYSMFLKRYDKSLRSGEKLIIITTAIIGFILLIAPLVDPKIDTNDFANSIFKLMSGIIFIIYIISLKSKSFLNLCFFQMDRYLINYNFYRSEEAIDKNLKLRLKTIIQRRLPSTTLISLILGTIFITYSSDIEIIKLIVIIVLPYILSLFFSLFHVSTYYLLQPYTFDGTTVSKLYKMLDSIIYIAVYIIFYLDIVFNLLTLIIVSIILSIISIILYVLVIKKGPKTFRVR